MNDRTLTAVLERYINGASFTRNDALAGLVNAKTPFRRNAARVASAVRSDESRAGNARGQEEAVRIEPYRHDNAHVRRMQKFLADRVADHLVGAYVHGSLATNEEIPYSDFDALVIIRSDVFSDEERLAYVAHQLDIARSIMFDYDPLQHHGWFVLAEHQLRSYPEHYMPVDLLRHAAALIGGEDHALRLVVNADHNRAREGFERMSSTVLARLQAERYPRNVYELKSLLSQTMLLPALYVQARDGRGVYKKYSFDIAQSDFAPDVWAIMHQVSAIRAAWDVNISPVRKRLLKVRAPLAHRARKRLAPPIPPRLSAQLDHAFYARIAALVVALRNGITAHATK